MPRLLVLDDDPDTLEVLAMLLEHSGFEVVGATASRIALAALSSHAFDVVLADLLVDSHDVGRSWEMIDELVRLAKPTPIGLLTGWPVNHTQLADHGIAFAIAKPFSSETLLAQLATALDVPPLSAGREATLRRYFASIERADWAALGELVTDDVVYHLPGSDAMFARSIHGRDAFCAFSVETFTAFAEPRFQIHEIRSLEHGAIVSYEGSWTDAHGRTTLPGSVLFVFDGDRIAQIGVRVDLAQLHSAVVS
jgi:two-component system response regulator VicR